MRRARALRAAFPAAIAIVLACALIGSVAARPDVVAAASCLSIAGGVFDAPGDDAVMPWMNGERIVVRNACTTSRLLTGWKVHDYGTRNVYRFPSGFRIAAGASITLRSGTGRNTATTLYWGRLGAIWNNWPPERAYLRSSTGTLVSSWTTPLRYVAPGGSDSNSGASTAPWRTLQRAADAAPAGATIFVRAGTYQGMRITRSGLTFAPYLGESAVVAGAGSRSNVVEITRVSAATIRGLTIRGNSAQYGAGLSVRESSGVVVDGTVLRDNRSFGLVVADSTSTTIVGNRITKNETGIEIRRAGSGTLVRGNQIYQNDRMVDSSRGANGINFYKSTGRITVYGNRLWGNHTAPDDPAGPDGGAFEIYGASNLSITGNLLWDNEAVMETGTDGPPCDNIVFARNVAFKAGTHVQYGLILRCASHSTIAHNTLDGLDRFAFDLSHHHGSFGGSIEGLRIYDNVAVNGRAYSIDSALPTSVRIDYNVLRPPAGQSLAYVVGLGNTTSLTTFRSWTGYDTHGLVGDPRFVDRAGRNYRLLSSSPAIDRGIVVSGVTGSYAGRAPDIGRYEYSP